VLDGDPAPPSQKKKGGHSPRFSAHVYCCQTARCIRIPLGTEVGLGPGDIVLDGDRAPIRVKGAHPPIFGPCLLWSNGWMDQDATWYGGRPWPRRHCVRWGPHHHPPLPRPKRACPIFGPILVWSNGRPSQLLLSSCFTSMLYFLQCLWRTDLSCCC